LVEALKTYIFAMPVFVLVFNSGYFVTEYYNYACSLVEALKYNYMFATHIFDLVVIAGYFVTEMVCRLRQ